MVASDRRERQEQAGQKMNNMGGANVVILKQPTIEEVKDELDNQPTCPITAVTQSENSATTQAPK